MNVPVSILIPVRNEAANLPRCLASVAWAAEVFVVDSASTDETVEIAVSHGARVVQFEFSGTWPKKKNWALDHLPFLHEWVLILDADEVLPPEAEDEIRRIVTSSSGHNGYWINRRLLFMGRWLKHSYYPNWNLRLFKHAQGRYEKLTESDTASGDNEVHEHVIVQGSTGFLESEMDHYAFPSVAVFVEKHNRYSNWEARVEVEGQQDQVSALQSPQVRWRRRLKRMARRLPGRSLLRFFYIYILQRGFLDGREGFYFARLHGIYESLTAAKVFELRQAMSNQAENSSDASVRKRPQTPPGSLAALPSSSPSVSWSLDWVRQIPTFIFCAFLVVVFFFTLRPSPRVAGLPPALGRWINQHDSWSNYLAFTLLAVLWFCIQLPPSDQNSHQRKRWRRAMSSLPRRAALFCALMVLIEFIQFCIPGRVYDLRDIAMGWLGALTAALLWKAIKYLGRHHSPEDAPAPVLTPAPKPLDQAGSK